METRIVFQGQTDLFSDSREVVADNESREALRSGDASETEITVWSRVYALIYCIKP